MLHDELHILNAIMLPLDGVRNQQKLAFDLNLCSDLSIDDFSDVFADLLDIA
jgi:hypothetical protein